MESVIRHTISKGIVTNESYLNIQKNTFYRVNNIYAFYINIYLLP